MTDRELRLRQRIDQLMDERDSAEEARRRSEEALEECRSGRKYWWNRASRLERQLAVRQAREKKQ